MSFTIGRTYALATNKDYSGRTNTLTNFKTTVTSGTATFVAPSEVIARVAAIVAAGSTAGIKGPGLPQQTVVSSATGTTLVAGTAASIGGTFEYSVYDINIPSIDDCPVIAFHVLTSGAAITFKTLNGQSVTLPAGSLAQGGIYDYSVASVTSITGSIFGLGAVSKPFII